MGYRMLKNIFRNKVCVHVLEEGEQKLENITEQ